MVKLLKDKLIDAWFFVRYKDPHPHLRIRLKLADITAFSIVVERTNACLKDVIYEKRIWRLQLDTYERELERYGVFMPQAETIFFYDSIAIADILHKLAKDQEKEEFRWLLSIPVIDQMLNDFAFGLNEKIALMKRLKSNFSKEFNIEKKSRIEIDKKYRHFKREIESLFSQNGKRYSSYYMILEERSKRILPIITTIRQLKIDKANVVQSVDQLVESFIHLSLNRLFSHTHRLQERVIYDFMWRFYTSSKARLLSKKTMHPVSGND
jgi:thiopeptide-type bacteriocin biosynthesis protein